MVEIIANRYRIETELGQGGMGTVYKGLDTHTQQIVAIKHLKPELTASELIERFKREGEALRELNHPNIVKMLDAVEENGNHYLIIEYLAGGDLADLLKQSKLPIEKVSHIAIDICDALTRAHRLSIIHRDLKPANVLIAEDGSPRLTDFGIAHFAGKARVTATDAIIGTVEYLAPEILDGELADPRADIWAFGVMLFEMLAGQRPFTGQSIAQTLMAIVTQPTPDLEALCPDAPIALVDLVYRMLEKDRHARIASVRHVGAELEDILQGRSTDKVILVQETRFATPTPDFLHRAKHNLPAQTTPFVGRESELSELAKLLDNPNIRLITIVAQGGMGKTRLALELAEKIAGVGAIHESPLRGTGFENGIYFIELAPLSDQHSMIPAIAEATGYQFQADERDQKQQIFDFLSNKHLLLLMDNYEHLLDGASLVTDILKVAPHVKILATSRQRLNQLGETVFNLQGMDFPAWETPDDALEYAAVKLFLLGAKRAKPDFEIAAENMDAIARICKLVEGLPLGILLAASWVSMLSSQEIAAEIAKSIDFLESDLSDVPERQRSMRAVFDYSWNLMTEDERAVFMKLAVFRGGFIREAAEVVADANLRTLMNLMNKSLIRRDAQNGRYSIHELLQQYGKEKLKAVGQLDATHHIYTAFFAKFMDERLPDLKGRRQIAALDEIESDFANVRAAWEYAVVHKDYNIIQHMQESLNLYCDMRSAGHEGIELFQAAMAAFNSESSAEARRVWAELQACYAQIAMTGYIEDPGKLGELLETSLEIAQSNNDTPQIAFCLMLLGNYHNRPEFDPSSLPFYEDSLQLYRDNNDAFYISDLLIRLGHIQEAIILQRESGNIHGLSRSLGNLAWGSFFAGDLIEADGYAQETMALMHIKRDLQGIIVVLCQRSWIAFWNAEFNKARELNKDALEKTIALNFLWGKVVCLNLKSYLASFIDEDYASGMEYAHEVILLTQKVSMSHLFIFYIGLAIATCGIGQYQVAHKYYQSAFKQLISNWYEYIPTLYVAITLLVHQNKPERAVEFLALINNHPEIPEGWRGTSPINIRLKTQLETELPPDVYAAAWERGKSLEIASAVRELLIEDETENK